MNWKLIKCEKEGEKIVCCKRNVCVREKSKKVNKILTLRFFAFTNKYFLSVPQVTVPS